MIKYFNIKELVPEHIFLSRGEKAWELLDYRALKTLEWLRHNLGVCTVNNWHIGGEYSQSGLRTFGFHLQGGKLTVEAAHKAISESLSQHKYGRAFDCKFALEANLVRQWIKDNWHKSGFDWAITLEEDVSWVHFDCRNQPENKVYSFKP